MATLTSTVSGQATNTTFGRNDWIHTQAHVQPENNYDHSSNWDSLWRIENSAGMPLLQQLNWLFKRRILHAWILHEYLFRASFRYFAKGGGGAKIEHWKSLGGDNPSFQGRTKSCKRGGKCLLPPPPPKKMKFCCYDVTANCFGECSMWIFYSLNSVSAHPIELWSATKWIEKGTLKVCVQQSSYLAAVSSNKQLDFKRVKGYKEFKNVWLH